MILRSKLFIYTALITSLLLPLGGFGLTIDAIRIENLDKAALDSSFVQAYTSLRVGQDVESEQALNAAVASDVDNLRRSGRFSFVRAFVEQEPNSLTLVYSVSPKMRLRAIEVIGAKGLGSRKIRKQLELEEGDYIDEPLVAEKALSLEAYFRKNKYPDASVAWEIIRDDQRGVADLELTVNEGEKLRVKEINFEGDRFLSDGRISRIGRFFGRIIPAYSPQEEGWFETRSLRSRLNQKKTWWITPWFGAYRPEVTDADLSVIRDVYLNEGFLDVRVSAPEVDRMGRGKLSLTYEISEGVQYRIGAVDITGVEKFSIEDLKNQIRIKSGDLASQSAIDSTAATLSRYYGNRGYIRSYVEPVISTDESTRLADILFRVREGDIANINEIGIRGNEKTRDEVIRRELAVYPGELFNQQKVETSERRLNNLSYFETVSSSYVPADESVETNAYDLTFNVKEKAMGSFLIGAGFSSVDSLVGFAEVSHGNFDIKRWPPVGDGQKVKVRVQAGSERNDLEVSFVEPWFRDRKLALGVDLYRRSASFYSDNYDLATTGGRLSLSKPLSPFTRGTLSYSLEQFDVSDVSTNVVELVSEEGSRLKSTVGVTVSRDTRDQYFIPTRGNQTIATAEFSGGPLGGDTEIYFLEAKSSQFWSLWGEHIFNIKGAVQVVDSYGSEDVPIFDRLFLGGPRSIRGFAYRDVSPRSVSDPNEPIGGRSSFYGTAEYTVPLWEKIRGAAFYDIGAVNSTAFDFSTTGLNSSYGIGARFDLPMFPLRLDYAFPQITDDANKNAGPRWNFLLGYTF